MTEATTSADEGTVDQSVFEGMFVRALKVDSVRDAALVNDLIAVGYDPAKPQPRYPGRVFREALRVTCRHLHPTLSEETALKELGKRFIEGFFQTIVGRLISTMLPFLNTESVVKRLPKFSAMTSTQNRIEVAAAGVWRATWFNSYAAPEFTEGLMDAGMRKGKLGTATLVSKKPGGFVLEFRAPEKG